MKINAINLEEGKELKKYADSWVALSPKTRKVICSSRSAKKALKDALSKGEDDPILTRVPKHFDSYVL